MGNTNNVNNVSVFGVYSKFMGYLVLAILILSLIGGGLKIAGVFSERVVFENSFQYKKGMESRALVLQSQISEIDKNIINNPDMRESLMAQRKVLEIQLKTTQL